MWGVRNRGVRSWRYPGGLEDQKKRLELEGHRVIQKGKKYIVENYEGFLITK